MKIKHLLFSLILIILGLACMLIENASSYYIDAQGMWHEYFFLLLVAWLLVITGIVVAGIGIFKDYKRK